MFLDAALRRVALALLWLYGLLLGPFFAGRCRFEPTCSRYAWLVFERFNFFHATYLTLRRLARCHPYCEGGCDWPPEK